MSKRTKSKPKAQERGFVLFDVVYEVKWTLGMGPVGSLETGLFPSW